MVNRILRLFGRESGSIHDAAYILAVFAFLSQVLGLLRDRLLANLYGAGATLDIYYAAFRVPDFIFVAIASLVSFSVIIPFLQEKVLKSGEDAKKFIDNVFMAFLEAIVLACVAAAILMPFLISLIFPEFDADKQAEVVKLSRILLLSPIFLGFSNLLASITQMHRRFVLYSLTPILYNLSIIGGIFFFMPSLGIKGIVIGVIVGAFLHAAIQVPFAYRMNLMPALRLRLLSRQDFRQIYSVVFHSLPRTVTLTAGNLVILVLVSLASRMADGSISILNFALNIQAVPLVIIGSSYSMAAFPVLSKLFSSGESRKFSEHMATALRHIIFLSLPTAALFIVLRAQIVRTILGSGQFNWNDTRLTAACLAIFVVAVAAQSVSMLITRAYYASSNTAKPFVSAAASSVFAILIPVSLVALFAVTPAVQGFIESLFKVEGVSGAEIISIPLGYAAGMIIQAAILLWMAKRDFLDAMEGVSRTFWQSLSAALMCGFASYIGLNIFDKVFDINTLPGIFLQGLLAGLIGIICGVTVLRALGSEEYKETVRAMKGKLFRATPVLPEQTDI